MSSTPDSQHEPTGIPEEIAPDGHVIFNVGDNKTPHRIRVSSAALLLASKPDTAFKGFFKPLCKEGRKPRSSPSPVEMMLPEDDPQAMSGLCRFLHFQTPPLVIAERNYDSAADRALQLAVVTDKYLCADALRYQMRAILQDAMEYPHPSRKVHPSQPWETEPREYALHITKVASAAYLLDQRKIFTMRPGFCC